MQLHELTKTTEQGRRRLGQGHGSGRGKTGGRGMKGQKSRGKVALSFEGGALPLTKRLPFLRGKGRNKVIQRRPIVLHVQALNMFTDNTVVDLEMLITTKLVDASVGRLHGVKILGDGTIEKQLIVKLPTSKGAAQKIEKAGGRVEYSATVINE